MTGFRPLGLDVLAFWRAIEYLTPASPDDATHKAPRVIRKPEDREGAWDIAGPEDLPWSEGLAPHYAATDKEIWRFVVTVGFSPVDDAMDELRELLGHLPDDAERPGGGGDMALASIVATAAGVYAEAAAVAPMPWAMGKVRAVGHPTDLDDFEAFEADVLERLGRFLSQADEEGNGEARPLTVETLKGLCDLVTAAADWAPRRPLKLLARVRAARVSLRQDGSFNEVEPDILGSFVAADLTRVRQALADGNVGEGLAAYLSGLPAGTARSDLMADPAAAGRWLSPALLPPARWPSKPQEKLVTAQQLAVNAAFARLKDSTGLFSVNGPPGTGKTTLLRDVVAAVIVERAKALAGLDSPENAFAERRQVAGNSLWTLDPRVKGFEMVVASTNNGAVENVTVELPGLNAVDPAWAAECDHFAAVARTLLDPEPGEAEASGKPSSCWALVAAVLGNRRNRSRFVSRFWWAEPGRKTFLGRPQPPHWQSFRTALDRLGRNPPDWRRACTTFRDRLADVERLLAPPVAFAAAQLRLREIAGVDAAWEAMERDVDAHLALRPHWLDLLRRPWAWWAWLRRGGVLNDRFQAMTRHLIDRGGHVRGRGLSAVAARRQSARDLSRRAEDEIKRLRATLPSGMTVVDAAFFARVAGDREKAVPWCDEGLDRARKRCLLAALDLHRAFLAGAHRQVAANLRQATDLLRGKLAPMECGEALEDLWASLFLVVPVVSTTFASFPRLFAGMGRESLGWLLVDEAGQATPQAAVGALWRSRRAVVIGDPLQIEPVVPLPGSVIEALRRRFGVAPLWHPVEHSAQVLADRANPLGAMIGKTWVGSPLRVHRRCTDPMFAVANAIAYDHTMVFGDVPTEAMPLGPSRWLDVGGLPADDGHFIPDQGAAVLDLLRHAGAALDQVFVVTPFRTVAQGMKAAARKAGLPGAWTGRNIGTVHTFQGKEAPMAILLLGGNPARPGAFEWAAARPNLLNVAVTRAKRAVYVVGDRGRWRELDYFERLDREVG
ncbi:MAG: ATP-binding protein [Magnetospirillum sp.]|nr:ATP-binding protein [Magnetospirillum sp.]